MRGHYAGSTPGFCILILSSIGPSVYLSVHPLWLAPGWRFIWGEQTSRTCLILLNHMVQWCNQHAQVEGGSCLGEIANKNEGNHYSAFKKFN